MQIDRYAKMFLPRPTDKPITVPRKSLCTYTCVSAFSGSISPLPFLEFDHVNKYTNAFSIQHIPSISPQMKNEELIYRESF